MGGRSGSHQEGGEGRGRRVLPRPSQLEWLVGVPEYPLFPSTSCLLGQTLPGACEGKEWLVQYSVARPLTFEMKGLTLWD